MDSVYINETIEILLPATIDTLYMVFITTIFSTIFGFIIGILLYITQKDGLVKNKQYIYNVLSAIVNVGRSIPFVIIIIAVFPLSRFIVGTSLGRDAAIVPLVVASTPFIARLVETAFNEVNKGVIEVAITSGASVWQIVYKVLIPETIHLQVSNITTACISIIGYSAMAGIVGGGGLGDVANRYGLQRFRNDILIYTIILLVLIVYIIQFFGTIITKKVDKS